MSKKLFSSLHINRQFTVIAALIISSVLCSSLLGLRIAFTRRFTYSYLVWNLFLAWLPVISAFIAYNLHQSSRKLSWLLVIICACLWLVFLPNAPYLITDLVHLYTRDDFSYWCDLIMFFTFAWTGIFLGLFSLYLMQELVSRIAGGIVSWVFVLGVCGLSGFGIYFGRFLRWNSWDVATQPAELVGDIWQGILNPHTQLRTFAFSGLFALFLVSSYLMLVAVTHLRSEKDQK